MQKDGLFNCRGEDKDLNWLLHGSKPNGLVSLLLLHHVDTFALDGVFKVLGWCRANLFIGEIHLLG